MYLAVVITGARQIEKLTIAVSLIESKKGVSFHLSDISSFNQLKNSEYEIKECCILCNTEKNYPLSKDIFVMSVNTI